MARYSPICTETSVGDEDVGKSAQQEGPSHDVRVLASIRIADYVGCDEAVH